MQHQDLSSSECDVRDEGGGADLDDCEIQEVVNTNKREESSEGVSNRSVQQFTMSNRLLHTFSSLREAVDISGYLENSIRFSDVKN